MEIYKNYNVDLTLYPDGIEGAKSYNLPLPNPTSDQVSKYLQLVSSTNMYGQPCYALEFHTPVPDIDQIRMTANMAAFQCNQLSESVSSLSQSIYTTWQSTIRASTSINNLYNYAVTLGGTKTFTGAVNFNSNTFFNSSTYFSSTIWVNNICPSVSTQVIGWSNAEWHFNGAFINTLYGSNVSTAADMVSYGKQVKDLVEYKDLNGYATETWVTSQNYATVAALDEYGATNVLSGTFSSIFDSASELGDLVIDIAFDSTIYALVYSIASYPDAKFVKQRLEILTEDRPILLDRFTRGSSEIYCDFNYRGIYGKIDCLARIYSVDSYNYCDLDTTYGIYTINLNLK